MNIRSKRHTIVQVAKVAGVSKQTVFRVINDRPDVALETRKRIQQVNHLKATAAILFRMDSVFIANDQIALAALQLACRRGLHIS